MMMTYSQRIQYRQALRMWLLTIQWKRLVTLNWNAGPLSLEDGVRCLKHWDAVVSRELLGRRWIRGARLFWCAVPEHLASNTHHHVLVGRHGHSGFDEAVQRAARKFPGASFDIRPVRKASGLVSYVTKELWVQPDRFILSPEVRS